MCSLKFVTFFAVQFVIVLATPPPLPPITDLPQEKWDELTQRAEICLEQLANEQGHRFKLIRIDNAQEQLIAGHSFIIQGQFQTSSGEAIECKLDLWKAASDGFEEYNLYCETTGYIKLISKQCDFSFFVNKTRK